ncbi:MAG: virulence factor Mce family protein [Solirubrobacterales bacterium]|jgi:virulence factor Mce-like protein|nr:virulence factor Mce family protein [Solirubrobacterales bacterium]
METRPPTVGRILIAVGFVISCFALALFLWLAFGGAIPLKPQGYRVTIPFNEATALAQESDVRISGVSVGKVKRIDLADSGFAEATVEIDSRYAPIPSDTEAILRQKTLLGETYVELTPGSDEAESLPEGGDLPPAQVSEAVQLDEIFRTFDERTRAGFRAWMQGQAAALRNQGENLSITIASLDPFAKEADRALRLLDSQSNALSGFLRSSGEVFTALSERQGQLRGLIQNSAAVFDTTARRNEDLAAAFEVFPTFLRESRITLDRLERFAVDTDPLVAQLRPSVRELAPTLADLGRLSTQLEPFFVGLRGTIAAAPQGSAALRRLLDDDLPPLLKRFDPFLAQLNPILEGVRLYRHEITATLGNVAATTQGSVDFTGGGVKHLRTEAPLTPEAVTTFPNRLQINRTNPYFKPKQYIDVRTALKSFETRHCTSGVQVTLPPRETTITDPAFLERVDGDAADAADLYDRLKLFTFEDQQSTAALGAPPCIEQGPFQSIGAPRERSDFLHTYPFP